MPTPEPTPEPGEELVRLASADNFRDVAGVAAPYAAADGRPLRRGRFYRSNELQLTDTDAASMAGLGIAAVYDLRSAHEVEAHPDVDVPGALWHHLEVGGIPTEAVDAFEDAAAGTAIMHEVYRLFVTAPEARDAFGELLRRLARTPPGESAVFHCTAGKDRTGWAAAMLLHAVGVDDAVILEDYLLSNSFSRATREKYLALIREHLGPEKVALYEQVFVVDAGYLQAGYDAVTASYGNRLTYLRDGLGVGDDDLAALRHLLLGDGITVRGARSAGAR